MNYTPIILTTIRLVFSIIILFPYTLYLTPFFSTYNIGGLILFTFLALTDFFDGYIAKRYNAKTYIGSILDPLADKVLIFSALLPMTFKGIVPAWFSCILLMRDFCIGSLREITAQKGFQLKPIFLAKIKTTFLLCFINYIYYNPNLYKNNSSCYIIVIYGIMLIIIILSLLSFIAYLKQTLAILKKLHS